MVDVNKFILKGRVCAAAIILVISAGLAACGGAAKTETDAENAQTEETVSETQAQTEDPAIAALPESISNEYVKIGKYKNIEVAKVEGLPEITDTAVDNNIRVILEGFSEFTDVDRPAQEGDAITLDYTVSVDGEEVEGAGASDYKLIIGDNAMFTGFDTSIIGKKAGDSYTLEHTYSGDYAVAALAGKTAVFDMKISKVQEVETPDLTDDFVQKVSQKSKTVEEYREEVREVLEQNNKDSMINEIRSKVWDSIMETTEVLEYPEDQIQEEKDSYYNYFREGAEFYEMEFEEFLKDKLEVSQESFEQQAQEAAEANVKENLAARLIAETVGIDTSDEAVQAGLEEMAKTLGFDSVDELVEDAPNRAYVERMVIREMVMDWAAEHSKQVKQ